ncbi:hypothetical protein LOTGIDRAFT_238613 [Lottia gigantea]|uniref:Uncharacterized protein n=1 Tax=Lottia gigantea TaxID=225164 RepID=V4CE85_LOTGI|nr:hypothetical protein LOTGIDRAFT_238613 [Lottia gigantea]ESP00275.1 hypothetical protein LOTGIDRAFT_238613 [Lottia gigantea]
MAGVDEGFQLPPGNWMARKLRLINDESKTLFPPKTSNSRKSYYKYDTIYRKEFKESANYDPKDRQQMFMQWKIPARILESPSSRDRSSVVPSRQSLQEPEKLARHSTLPEINLSKHIDQIRPATHMSSRPKRTPSRALGTPAQSARLFREKKPSVDIWRAEEEKAKVTKKSKAQALRTHDDQKHIMVNRIRKTLDPEARKMVDKWLESATEADRRMAIKLFATLDNNNLPDTEKQIRIEGILKLIRRKHGGDEPDDLCSKMKYIRLQDAETRNNRWMHATWHHLPQYKDWDPVNNTSSMYTRPHEPTPHDYVIHPDWG